MVLIRRQEVLLEGFGERVNRALIFDAVIHGFLDLADRQLNQFILALPIIPDKVDHIEAHVFHQSLIVEGHLDDRVGLVIYVPVLVLVSTKAIRKRTHYSWGDNKKDYSYWHCQL